MKRSHFLSGAASVLTAAIVVFLASDARPAQAAETPAASPFGERSDVLDLDNAYQPPMVYADAVDVRVQDGALAGSFLLINDTDEAISDLGYRIEIYGDALGETPSADPQVLFARLQSKDVHALMSKEKKAIPLTFALPSLPKGAYVAQVQVLQTGGRKLGWGRAPFAVEKGATEFAYVYGQSIVLPEFDNKEVEPLTGPNVDPSGSLVFTAGVQHSSLGSETFVPTIEWHEFDSSRPVTATVSFDAVTVNAGDASLLTLPIKAPSEPGTYVGQLTLRKNGAVASTVGQYRIVVRGKSADLISARLATVATKKGETAFARIDYVGSADAETRGLGTLTVELRDADGVAGSLFVPEIRLTDGVGRGTARIELTRDLSSEPVLRVVIGDDAGNVLRDASVPVALTEQQLATIKSQSSWKVWAAWYVQPYYLTIAFVALSVAIALGFLIHALARRVIGVRTSVRAATAAAAMAFVMCAQLPFAFAFGGSNGIEVFSPITVGDNENYTSSDRNAYRAYWGEIYSQPTVALFVNRPVHNSTYQCNVPVPFEYRVDFAACDNMPSGGRVLAHFDLNQNFQSTLLGTNANWVKVYDQTYNQPANCSTHACVHSYSQNTTLNLNASGLPANATKTTLRVVVKHNPYLDGGVPFPDDTVSYSDFYFSRRVAQAFNIWLNFVCASPKADIQIVKSAVTPSVNQGNQASYGITVRNNGPDTASNVTVTDAIPSGLTFVSSSDNRCAQQGSTIACNFGNMANGATISATFTFQTSVATVCGNVPNTAVVSTTTQDDNMSNNQSTASIQVNCPVQQGCIDVVKEAYDAAGNIIPVVPQFTFTLDGSQTGVNNSSGNLRFTNVPAGSHTVTETLPSGWQQINVTPANGVVNVPASNQCVTVVFKNRQTTTPPTTGCIDIIKTTLNTAGNVLTPTAQFTFTLDGNQSTQNDSTGRARFNNVPTGSHTVAENVPSGWTMVSMSPTGGLVNVVASQNNASCSQVYVLNQQNNVTVNADLAIVKTGPSTALRGSTFTYQLNVTNNGPQSANNVVVTDQVPSDLVILPASTDNRCSVSGQTVTCQLGTMTSGQQTTINISVMSNAVSGSCSQVTITNRATVTSSTPDSNQSNNSSQANTTLTCPSTNNFCPSVSVDTDDDEVDAGDEIDYEIRVRNDSNQTQTFDLTAFLDRDTEFVDASGNPDDNDDEVNWEDVSINANSSRTFRLTVETDNDLSDGDSVRLRVETDCDSDSVETDINEDERIALGEANLTIDKAVNRNEALPGDVLSYTLTIRNTGSASINDVVVDDVHTSNRLTIFSAPGGTVSGNSIHWDIGTMARGATRVLHYTASVSLDAQNGDLIPNTATVTAPGQRASDSEFVHVLRILPQTGTDKNVFGMIAILVGTVGAAGAAVATRKFLA